MVQARLSSWTYFSMFSNLTEGNLAYCFFFYLKKNKNWWLCTKKPYLASHLSIMALIVDDIYFQVLVIDYKLTYPSGTATAVLINGFHTKQGDKNAKYGYHCITSLMIILKS